MATQRDRRAVQLEKFRKLAEQIEEDVFGELDPKTRTDALLKLAALRDERYAVATAQPS